MPNYNVTVSTEFTMEVTADSPEAAAQAFEVIPNNENEIILNILKVEEINIPDFTSGEYVSLRSFHEATRPTADNSYTPLSPRST